MESIGNRQNVAIQLSPTTQTMSAVVSLNPPLKNKERNKGDAISTVVLMDEATGAPVTGAPTLLQPLATETMGRESRKTHMMTDELTPIVNSLLSTNNDAGGRNKRRRMGSKDVTMTDQLLISVYKRQVNDGVNVSPAERFIA